MRGRLIILAGLLGLTTMLLTEAFAQETCWKATYGRRVTVPDYCSGDTEPSQGLCYAKPRRGFKCEGTNCTATACPAGWHGSHVDCRKPKPTDACPPGYKDTGLTCIKPSYDRGVARGTPQCMPGTEPVAGLCYSPCRDGYKGIGVVCWGNCPKVIAGRPSVDCGAMCGASQADCAEAIGNQILGTIQAIAQVVSMIATGGIANAAGAVGTAASAVSFVYNSGTQAAQRTYVQNFHQHIKSAAELGITTALDMDPPEAPVNVATATAAANSANLLITALQTGEVNVKDVLAVDPLGIGAAAANFILPTCEGPGATPPIYNRFEMTGETTISPTIEYMAPDGTAWRSTFKGFVPRPATGNIGDGHDPENDVFGLWHHVPLKGGKAREDFSILHMSYGWVPREASLQGPTQQFAVRGHRFGPLYFRKPNGTLWRAEVYPGGGQRTTSLKQTRVLHIQGPEALWADPRGRIMTDNFNYITWDLSMWNARRWGAGFIHRKLGAAHEHSAPIINYKTWDGTNWTAQWTGNGFRHTREGSRVSHESPILEILDWSGGKVTVTWDRRDNRFLLINPATKEGHALYMQVYGRPAPLALQPGEFRTNWIEYLHWNRTAWVAWREGAEWVHQERDPQPGQAPRIIRSDRIEYLAGDWSPWTARWNGTAFVHTRQGASQGHTDVRMNYVDWVGTSWFVRFDPGAPGVPGFIARVAPNTPTVPTESAGSFAALKGALAADPEVANQLYFMGLAGKVVMTDGSPTVYLIGALGTKHAFPNPDVFLKCGFQWSQIVKIKPDILKKAIAGHAINGVTDCQNLRNQAAALGRK